MFIQKSFITKLLILITFFCALARGHMCVEHKPSTILLYVYNTQQQQHELLQIFFCYESITFIMPSSDKLSPISY